MNKIYEFLGINLILSNFSHFWAIKDLLWPEYHLKLYWGEGGGSKECTYKKWVKFE